VFVKEVGNWDSINILVNTEWEICLILESLSTSLAQVRSVSPRPESSFSPSLTLFSSQVYFLDRAYKISKKNNFLLAFCSLTVSFVSPYLSFPFVELEKSARLMLISARLFNAFCLLPN